MQDDFKKRFNDDYYTYATYNGIAMLIEGIGRAKSTDPVKVASAMSGLKFRGFNGEVEMRKSDHQLLQPLFITEWRKSDAKNPYSVENTGWNFQPVKQIASFLAATPTSCQMKRP
jgi:branched-chain amino acid transport system substrate-binding protein